MMKKQLIATLIFGVAVGMLATLSLQANSKDVTPRISNYVFGEIHRDNSGRPLALRYATSEHASSSYNVLRVVDGDTIDIEQDGERVRIRLIGIDTPEVVDPRKPVQCFGRESSAHANELLSGKLVRIEEDPSQGEYDTYGRMLAYVYLPDGRSFNKLMIREGYAHEYTYHYPYKYQTEFKAAERDARSHGRGLWALLACSGTSR